MKIGHFGLKRLLLVIISLSFRMSATALCMNCMRSPTNPNPPYNGDASAKFQSSCLRANSGSSRREALASSLAVIFAPCAFTIQPLAANAYEPDPDEARESLYFISRVQEATCLQERYIKNKNPPIRKMKLSLKLVDKSYRLLDQINYLSKSIPNDDIVAATQSGNEAADSLQSAIDFVNSFGQDGNAITREQKEFLISAMTETREKLFEFLDFYPDQKKLGEARTRVETENKLNIDEFDPDLVTESTGVYNPVVLPWKVAEKS